MKLHITVATNKPITEIVISNKNSEFIFCKNGKEFRLININLFTKYFYGFCNINEDDIDNDDYSITFAIKGIFNYVINLNSFETDLENILFDILKLYREVSSLANCGEEKK